MSDALGENMEGRPRPLVENQKAIELEAELILQRRSGDLRLVANFTGECELYYDSRRDVEVEISAGATVEVTPVFHVGVEGWMRGERPTNPAPDVRIFPLGPHVYVGPHGAPQPRQALVVGRRVCPRHRPRSHDAARRAIRRRLGPVDHRGRPVGTTRTVGCRREARSRRCRRSS